MFFKKILIPATLLLPVILGLAQPSGKQQPNIIYILADDMGHSDMGWQGSPIQTPNLDRLRAGGMFLQRHYVQPQCSPTRVALLSGNYPYRFGLHEHIVSDRTPHGLPGRVKTIAEKLKEAGYRTAVIGKWHVGSRLLSQLPQHQGFDHSFVCMSGAISYWNYSRAGRPDVIRNGEKYYPPSPKNSEASGNTYATELWKQEAVELIRGHDQQQPLFLYLPFNAPHHPLQAPQQLIDKYAGYEIEDYWAAPDASLKRTAEKRRTYMAMVDAMDAAIGEILSALEKKNMLENTLIVFSSDNGGIPEADNRPLRSYKGDAFEGGVRVPGIAFWPAEIQAGSSSSELVYVADWYATFAEIAGLSMAGERKDGVSALDVIRGKAGKREAVPIISAGRHAYISRDFALVGAGENYWRMLQQNLSGFRLYDLKADVSQKRPTDLYPALKKHMQQMLGRHFRAVERGYFNWDILYGKYQSLEEKGDHNRDLILNDLPKLEIDQLRNQVLISPLSGGLHYTLQASPDEVNWRDIGAFTAHRNEDRHIFTEIEKMGSYRNFRVLTKPHAGLPLRDAFSPETGYQYGALSTGNQPFQLTPVLPPCTGFLPVNDLSGGNNVYLTEESLSYPAWPLEGGALQLRFKDYRSVPALTRYFTEPHNHGKRYAAMLVQFEGGEAECTGEINWLVQNGWNGSTAKQLTLSLQQDGVYLDLADPGRDNSKTWLGEHYGQVVCILFEFDLGPTGQDRVKVYLNPKQDNSTLIPAAVFQGEFTFDRLQFQLIARAGSIMTIDELRMGSKLEEVLP